MELSLIGEFIQRFGYFGLFIWLWLGVFGIPIPNEVIVMSIAAMSAQDMLHPLQTFVTAYLGIVAALSTLYLLGRFVGTYIILKLIKKKKFKKLFFRSKKLMEKYHAFAIFIAYFIPGVRILMPILYGLNKLPFKKFALYGFSGALCWLTIVFSLGFMFGESAQKLIKYENQLLAITTVAILVWGTYKLITKPLLLLVNKHRARRAMK